MSSNTVELAAAAAPLAATWKSEDGIGSIEVLEVFGSDLTVVNAARVSFNKTVDAMTERDAKLVKFLADHDHVSPFFHPQVRLRVKMPIFVAREWFRHTIGFARNEVSRRYVDSEPEVWFPSVEGLRERDPKLKQGSKETPVGDSAAIVEEIRAAGLQTVALYNSLLARGVAPEIARAVLPQGMYTEFIETGSLAAYARLWALRTDPGAQREIQGYARGIEGLLKPHFPVSWSALTAAAAAAGGTA
jgi:thymidylate synthase (FAD)